MKTLCASVLIFEAIVVLLAIPVAIVVSGVSAPIGIGGGLALMLACIFVGASQRRSWGLIAGWIVQVLVILTGFIVPTMFLLGAIFAILWFYAIRVGQRGDAIKAAREAQSEPTGNTVIDGSGDMR
jgi:dolichol kinase